MYLSKELYKNKLALQALQAVLKAKGRKVKGLNEQVQTALATLSLEGQQELLNLVLRINTSFNYRKLRLKAVHTGPRPRPRALVSSRVRQGGSATSALPFMQRVFPCR